MKLPFSFGTKLIFRLVLPGLLLALLLAPLTDTFIRLAGYSIPITTRLPFEMVFWGWLVVVLDMPIYMLLEGRRFWPSRLRNWGVKGERARLKKLIEAANPATRRENDAAFTEVLLELSYFPIDEDGNPYVIYPTKLGNLLAAYEKYPYIKYGLDSVFYWYRLWVVLDKDLRDEIDNHQALPDSAVYITIALGVAALVLPIYAVLQFCGMQLAHVSFWWVPLVLAVVAFMVAWFVYRFSLYTHAQFGEFYKALFDQFRSRLQFEDVVDEVRKISKDMSLEYETDPKKARAVWRYLRHHMVWPPGESAPMKVGEWTAKQNKEVAELQQQSAQRSQDLNAARAEAATQEQSATAGMPMATPPTAVAAAPGGPPRNGDAAVAAAAFEECDKAHGGAA